MNLLLTRSGTVVFLSYNLQGGSGSLDGTDSQKRQVGVVSAKLRF